MNAEFFSAVEDIEKEKGIPREYMFEKSSRRCWRLSARTTRIMGRMSKS